MLRDIVGAAMVVLGSALMCASAWTISTWLGLLITGVVLAGGGVSLGIRRDEQSGEEVRS